MDTLQAVLSGELDAMFGDEPDGERGESSYLTLAKRLDALIGESLLSKRRSTKLDQRCDSSVRERS